MKRVAFCVLLVCAVLAAAANPRQVGAAGLITSPRDRSSVRGQVPIEGTATDASFQKYEIHYGPEPNPGDQWTPIAGSPFSVPVVQGRVGLWDTTVIPDGLYSLRLRVVRLDGNYDEFFVRGVLVANTRPTETPTPRDSPTPSAPTNTPAPTPTVLIAVPAVFTPTALPSETPLPTAVPTATSEPPDLPFGITGVGDAAVRGAGIVLVAFAGIGVLFALRGALFALVRWLMGRDEDLGT